MSRRGFAWPPRFAAARRVRRSARTAALLASAFVLVLALAGQAQAGPGELDPTFSGDGMQTTDFGSGFGSTPDQGSSVAVGPDGKTLVVGATSQPVTGNDFALARYNVDGTLDATFSGDGIQTTNFGTTEAAFAVALAPGGKIVVAGYTHPSDGTPQDYAVARYNADGTLDTTFSDDGKQVTGFGFSLDVGQGLVVAPDGKILVTGYSIVAPRAQDSTSRSCATTPTARSTRISPAMAGKRPTSA